MTGHACHAVGCTKKVPPSMLFCPRHWRMTPEDTKRLVWRAYRPGQEVDKRPSPIYIIVQSIAVAEVAVLDGRYTPSQQEAHVKGVAERVWPLLSHEQNVELKRLMDSYRPNAKG